ncbi:MAG: Sir2 family NAD-dependent protein deacetylase [Cyclobacteriaceae bacterium]
MKKLVVLTGAGISAESGLKTFRDDNGLWEGHNVMSVASITGWHKDKAMVLDFYNKRRKACLEVAPNAAHYRLAAMEKDYEITIITQNVDDLHEKAGSTHIIHLHGELFKSQSTSDPSLVYNMDGWELKMGDKCEKGSQLRPFIVWFGETVPKMEEAMEEAMDADIFAVVGTSMLVYPAAGLIDYVPESTPKFVIDVKIPFLHSHPHLIPIEEKASTGIVKMENRLKNQNLI